MLAWIVSGGWAAEPVVWRHGRAPGGAPLEILVRDGKIVEVGPSVAAPGVAERDLGGAFVVPAAIDSHVHLVYDPVGPALAAKGVAAAIDLAAPLERIGPIADGPRMRWSGPMITAVRGYPTTSWGSGGYGRQCASADEAEAAVRRVVAGGATLVKIPLVAPALGDDALRRAVATAHALGVPVAVHALDDAGAARGAAFGADVLAHTPVEPLSPATVAAWSGKVVVSTVTAFGGSADAVENLRRLRAAGATVLYGTDLGNTRTVGIDPEEIRALQRAGLDGAAILAALTADPAKYWGFSDLGALAPGAAASLLVLDRDPLADPLAWTEPREVWVDGRRR